MHVNNSKQLRLCAALIIVSIFVHLPTSLVFGQNEATHTISINEDGGSTNTNILESSRVEYNSSGWTDFTITALNATYQVDGVEKDFFDVNYSLGENLSLESFIYFNVYSGSGNKLIDHNFLFILYVDLLSITLFDSSLISLENESSISLVFYIINNNRTFEDIKFRYSVEAEGESVGIPTTLSPEGTGIPFSSIALIAAFAALGAMVTLISVKRIKFRR